MTMQELLLEAVEQRVLRPLDVQFAMMVAGEEPEVMLAAALLSKDAGEGHVCLPLSRLVPDEQMPAALQSCFVLLGNRWTGRLYYSALPPSAGPKRKRR